MTDITTFISTYKKWLETRQWANKTKLSAESRALLALANSAKRKAWLQLPETRRRVIVTELISQGYLPPETTLAINIFDAKIVGL